MKQNFEETIGKRSDEDLQRIARDVAFYSGEERLIAIDELERRGVPTEEHGESKKLIEDSLGPPMPGSVSIERIYARNMVITGSILGGPLAVGYLLAANFEAFGNPKAVRLTWILTVIGSLIIFTAAFFVPDGHWGRLLSFVSPIAAGCAVEYLQRKKIEGHIAAGGRKFGWGRVIVVSLICSAITFAAIAIAAIAIAVFSDI